MYEEVGYKRRLCVMIFSYIRHQDSADFDIFSLRLNTDFCCMNCSLAYCGFMSFPSVWLEQLDLKVCPQQVHTDSSARVLLGWHNIKDFAPCLSKRTQQYISVDTFSWRAVYGHRFLHIPTPLFFAHYSGFAYGLRYRPLLRVVALTKLGDCSSLRVLYILYRGAGSILGNPTSPCGNERAPLAHSPALLDVARQLNPLGIIYGMKYDAAQSLVVFIHLESIDWSASASNDFGSVS